MSCAGKRTKRKSMWLELRKTLLKDGTSGTPLKKVRFDYVESKGLSRSPDKHEHRFGIRNLHALF